MTDEDDDILILDDEEEEEDEESSSDIEDWMPECASKIRELCKILEKVSLKLWDKDRDMSQRDMEAVLVETDTLEEVVVNMAECVGISTKKIKNKDE